jgi:hypothetical protein
MQEWSWAFRNRQCDSWYGSCHRCCWHNGFSKASLQEYVKNRFEKSLLISIGGIGPTDQLNVVKSSSTDGATMISQDQWINLPVGYNLDDHVGVSAGMMTLELDGANVYAD